MTAQDKIDLIAQRLGDIEDMLVSLGADADTAEKRRALVKAHRLTNTYHSSLARLAREGGGFTTQAGGDK